MVDNIGWKIAAQILHADIYKHLRYQFDILGEEEFIEYLNDFLKVKKDKE